MSTQSDDALDQYQVLLVEDDPDDVFLVRSYLRDDQLKSYCISHAESLGQAMGMLKERDYDVILLDLGLPDAESTEALSLMLKDEGHTPIIVLTIQDDQLGESLIRQGAADYVPKRLASKEMLSRSIRYSVERHRLIKRLHEKAERDALTGLANRSMFYEQLDFMIAQSQRNGQNLALIMMDFDKFKNINDTKGHRFGDLLLKAFADRLKSITRKSDYAARFGGDEFLMLVSNFETEHDLKVLIKHKQETLCGNYMIDIDGQQVPQRLSVSFGVMRWHPGTNGQQMLERADQAMYESKRNEKAELTFY